MKLRTVFAAVTLGLGLAGAAPAENLADALTRGYNASGLLDQNRALLRAADEDVAQTLAALRPIISWSANMTYRNVPGDIQPGSLDNELTSSAQIDLQLLLYDFGASDLATEAAKESVLQARQQLIGVEQQVLFRIVSAYMSVRSNSETVALRRNNLNLIQEELRAARDRFEVGEITRTDVSLAEAALAAARADLAVAEGNLAQAIEEYTAAVGDRPGALAVVDPAPLPHGLDGARAFAVRNHPDILAARHGVAAAELNIARAEAAMQPDLSLNGSITLDEDFDTTETLGLRLSGPIYQGGQLQSLVRQAMARRDAARANLLVVTQEVDQTVGTAYALLRVAQAQRGALDEQVRAAQVAFRGVREEAQLGARTTLDVLNAEQDLLDARAAGISAQADEVVASYRVLQAMGLLTADHLNLPVQRYDPAAYYNLVRDAPATYSEQGQALDRVLDAIGD
ncbi:MAG: type I secretion system outer membrane protein TolC [Rhodobacteraceae bacterium HLUCCA08]|nr:MAG: type I secretion system outer membrane protein TolC [Rhodobacteraceae bacterium HLUCCA08]